MTKVLIVSETDIIGGAARATYRLHQALKETDIHSQMLTQMKHSHDPSVYGANSSLEKGWARLVPNLNTLPLFVYPHRSESQLFSTQLVPNTLFSKIQDIPADIINLHWVCGGYMSIKALSKCDKPIVWTLHDMWPFTGGCHYSNGCTRYTESCGKCPQLGSHKDLDLSYQIWRRKIKSWKSINLTIVALNNWMANLARSSTLFSEVPIKIIPNCVNTNIYRPIEKKVARHILNLPQNKKLVLFGAMNAASDPRKGSHLLKPTLSKMMHNGGNVDTELVVFGTSKLTELDDLGVRVNFLGELNDDITLTLSYSAADIFVLPSMEDNLPNTIMESMACGTPCIAFEVGGVPDLIDHLVNGFLVKPFDTTEFAHALNWVLQDDNSRETFSINARNKVVAEYTMKNVASKYQELFEQIRQS